MKQNKLTCKAEMVDQLIEQGLRPFESNEIDKGIILKELEMTTKFSDSVWIKNTWPSDNPIPHFTDAMIDYGVPLPEMNRR